MKTDAQIEAGLLTKRQRDLWARRDSPDLTETERGHLAHLRNEKPKPQTTQADECTNRGPATGETVDCPSCGGSVHLKVFPCKVHGRCTLKTAAPGVKCCNGCLDRIRPNTFDLDRSASEYVHCIPPYPDLKYSGQGIVICGGGKYWPSVYVTVRMLRLTGCKLPVQVWYLGEPEKDDRYERLLRPFGVEVVDALAHPEAKLTRGLTGFPGQPPYECKSFAVLHSPFREVLYIDADNYPVADPTILFSCPRYKLTGAVFWPDLDKTNKWTNWPAWGVEPFGPECGIETGQYLIDKRQAWEPLLLHRWYDDHGDTVYDWGKNYGHGDTGPPRVAWAKLRRRFTMYSTVAKWQGVAFIQPGPDGEPLFVHRCQSKISLEETHFPSTPAHGFTVRANLPGEEAAFGFLEELRAALAVSLQTA